MQHRLPRLFASRPKSAEAWLARMGRPDVSARDQASFMAWLEADPDHLRQYESAKALHAGLGDLRGDLSMDLARLRSAEPRRPTPDRRGLVLAGGLAMAGLAAAVILRPMLAAPETRLYRSPPGRVVDVALDDGSRLTLDSGSAVRVTFAADARRLTLEEGAAYFEVAHEAGRPFQVAVGDRRVIVTGTRFVTAFTGDGAEIFVLHGRVVVGRRDAARPDALDGALPLVPGERAVFRPGEPGVRKAPADVEAATAWRTRRLVFREAPVSEVIAAAARYSDVPLVAADPALARIRVTTVLPLEGDGALADRMAALLPVRSERAADGRVLFHAD
ncbi:MAG: FecR family protein [Phenylobacterium sp.]|uniref:FecR family protein n=1 Tax=Phenylobacterium sp. TaxID=1871053 RepID=UPI0039198B7E